MSAEDEVKNLIRNQLEYSEGLTELTETHSWEEIDDALISVTADLINAAEDPERKRNILVIVFRIGESIESKRVVSFAKEHLEEWKDKYE